MILVMVGFGLGLMCWIVVMIRIRVWNVKVSMFWVLLTRLFFESDEMSDCCLFVIVLMLFVKLLFSVVEVREIVLLLLFFCEFLFKRELSCFFVWFIFIFGLVICSVKFINKFNIVGKCWINVWLFVRESLFIVICSLFFVLGVCALYYVVEAVKRAFMWMFFVCMVDVSWSFICIYFFCFF